MAKNMHKNEFDDGTLVKIDIVRRYLKEWLYVPITKAEYNRSIYLYDFFAGSGNDAEGHPGSPIVILETLMEHCTEFQNSDMEVNVLFNDLAIRKINTLREKCSEQLLKCPNSATCKYRLKKEKCIINISYEAKDFKQVFREEISILNELNNPFSFMFIDQYGIKYVDNETFSDIAKLNRVDVLFFTSTAYARRFSEHPAFLKYLKLEESGLKEENPEKCHRAFCDFYRSMIPDECTLYLSPFSIKKKETGMIYGLIFASSNLLGIEKFLKVAWDIDPSTGEANFDIDGDNIINDTQMLFPDERKPKKVDQYQRDLYSFIMHGRTNKEVYTFSILSGFLPTKTYELLCSAEKEGRIKIERFDGKKPRKASFYLRYKEEEQIRIYYE